MRPDHEVLEGLGRALDPSINILLLAAPIIAREKLRDWYMSGRGAPSQR